MPPTRPALPSTHPSLLAGVEALCRDAWGTFFRRYAPVIRHWCLRHRLPAEVADDLTQSLLTDLPRKLRSYRTEAGDGGANRFRSWLRAVVRNAAADHTRARARRGADFATGGPPLDPPAPAPTAELESALYACHREDVWAAVDAVRRAVRPDTWAMFEAVRLHGAAAADVAARFGKSVGAVYVAAHRVAGRLREEYGRVLRSRGEPGGEFEHVSVPDARTA